MTDNVRPAPPSFLSEMGMVAAAVRENTTLIAAGIVFLTSASIYNYATTERVAINVMSAELVAAIPLYFSFIVFIVVLLTGALALSSLVVLEGAPRDRHGRILVVPAVPSTRGAFFKVPLKKAATVAAPLWLLTYWLPGLIFIALGCLTAALDGDGDSYLMMALLSWLGTFVAVATLSMRIRRPNRHRAIRTSRSMLILCSLWYSAIMSTAIVITLQYCTSQGHPAWQTLAWLLVVTGLLAGVQFLAALVIAHTSRHGGTVRQSILGAVGLVTLVCLIPDSSAFVSRIVFSLSSIGPAACVQFALAPGQMEGIVTPASTTGGTSSTSTPAGTEPVWTHPMRVIAPYDDTLQVRRTDDPQTVYRVKKADIQAVRFCPR